MLNWPECSRSGASELPSGRLEAPDPTWVPANDGPDRVRL